MHSEDDVEIVAVPVTDRADEISVENGFAVNGHVLN